MKCQDCQKREATIFLKRIINDEKIMLNLCPVCAKRRGFSNPLKNIPFPLADFLSSMVGEQTTKSTNKLLQISCPNCGLNYETFSSTGRLGCGVCFSIFRQPMADLLRKIHGSNLHRGKRPKGTTEMEPMKEEARLKAELKDAIINEDFERAAQVRDLIKELQEQMETSDV